MLEDAGNALVQMFSAPLRALLWKTIGLSLLLVIVAGAALERLLVHLLGAGGASLEAAFGPQLQGPAQIAVWLLSFAAGIGIVVGSVMLMPAATALVGGFFADSIADAVEQTDFPADPPGRAVPLWLALWEGIKTALLALVIYLCAAPLLLFAGSGAVIFFLATAYILGRGYFELAAMRFRPPAAAKALRRRHAARIYLAGLIITAFVSIPIVNLATPLFAMALMVHVHKRIGALPPAIAVAR